MSTHNGQHGHLGPLAGLLAALLLAGCATTQEPAPVAEPAPAPEPKAEAPNPPPPPPAPAPKVKPAAPMTYVVQKGDTLWDISKKFLDDPWYWPEIWVENPHIKNPHLIYPGDVLTLYFVNGRPRVKVTGGPRVTGLPTVKLEPRVRTSPIGSEDLTIPVRTVQQFLIRPQVLPREQIEAAPYIVGTQEGRLIYGEGYIVYVRGLGDARVNDLYEVYHPGRMLRDPETGKEYGQETFYVASAVVVAAGDPATVKLSGTKREALRGDFLLPVDHNDEESNFYPKAPPAGTEGHVVALFNALSKVGQHQVVTLNLGANQGIERGHVFVLYNRGNTIRDRNGERVELPPVKAGLGLVFRVLDDVSYALVLDSTLPVGVGDLARAP